MIKTQKNWGIETNASSKSAEKNQSSLKAKHKGFDFVK